MGKIKEISKFFLDIDNLILAKLIIKFNFFKEDEIIELIKKYKSKNLIYILLENNLLDIDKLKRLICLKKSSVICPSCLSLYIDVKKNGNNVIKCKKCDQDIFLNESDELEGIYYGEYKILKKIGEGSMGKVYKGIHKILKKEAAIKILKDTSFNNIFERFKREAQLISMMSHENIIKLYEVGECYGDYYIAMEYIDGVPLSEKLKNFHKISLKRKLLTIIAIAKGLEHAHERNIIHRDIKPDNIIVNFEKNIVKITDFGLARKIKLGEEDVKITKRNVIVGTPLYMSYEQVMGYPLDNRTDIFSLGIILYELLVGVHPFKGNTQDEILKNIRSKQPTPPNILNANIPRNISEIVLKALKKNRNERFQSAKEFYKALESYLDKKTQKILRSDLNTNNNLKKNDIKKDDTFESFFNYQYNNDYSFIDIVLFISFVGLFVLFLYKVFI